MLARTCLAFTVLCVLACNENRRSPLSAVRDSAGITIVESQGARWGQDLPTRVADELLGQVGAAHGSESEELFRVGQIRWLDDNQFILANSRTELRVYSLHGELVRQLGGEGEGPGEYRQISGISVLRNGNLVVADTRLRRITFLDPLGQVLRTTEAQGPVPVSTDLVDDQWFVGRGAATGRGDGPRVDRLVDSIVAVNTESGERSIWATTPGVRVDWRQFPNGVVGPYNFAITPVSCVAGRGDRVVFGSPDVYELREQRGEGELVRILRLQVAARPISEQDKQPVIDRWKEVGAPPYGEPVFPDSLPHFRALFLDDVGRTWVQVYEGRNQIGPEWDIFGPEGAYLGRVILPEGFIPRDVFGEKMVGVWRDSLDVEYVQVRKVVLPGTG